jgi:hypothetical protein
MTRIEHLGGLIHELARANVLGVVGDDEALYRAERLLYRYLAGLNLDVEVDDAFAPWLAGWEAAGQEEKSDRVRVARERSVKTDYARDPHLPAPVQPEGVVAEPVVAGRSIMREPPAGVSGAIAPLGLNRFTVYKAGLSVVYVEDAVLSEHHVPEAHWGEYLRLRRSSPRRVVLYDRLQDARLVLAREHKVRI